MTFDARSFIAELLGDSQPAGPTPRLLSDCIARIERQARAVFTLAARLAQLDHERTEVAAELAVAQLAAAQLEQIAPLVSAVLDSAATPAGTTGGSDEPEPQPAPEAAEASPEPDTLPAVSSEQPGQEEADTSQDGRPAEAEPEPAEKQEDAPATNAERLLAYLGDQGVQTSKQLSEALGMSPGTVSSLLSRLCRAGRVLRDDAEYPAVFRLAGAEPVPEPEPEAAYALPDAPLVEQAEPESEPAGEPEPAPTPEPKQQPTPAPALTDDQQAVMDLLGDGALYGNELIGQRLTFARTRVERAVNGLAQAGLIGTRGGQWVLLPAEPRGQEAS